ncbi:hypothetical protein [Pelagibacterium sp. H642]|uniref:hypothetical protein n=1 Tax=Pelagibacterium sp. H642 TaxID=1881069 RepID=UPI0028160D29|nr:hypothetical protein [Pelagibacterium sp. H642]WMT92905.1 hypothetical protein NO934_19200 [Pelagibacterium sp. H642]
MTMRTATEMVASSRRPAVDVAGRLGLAAAPTFALMAWISAVGSPGMTMCSATSAFVPINDMALMYVLMSLFHLSPWMKLLSARSQRPNTQTEGD